MTLIDIRQNDSPRSLLSSWDMVNRDFERMFDEMERMLMPMRSRAGSRMRSGEFVPVCELNETQNEFIVALEVPGMTKNDIEVEITGNEIRVSGEKKKEHEENEGGVFRSERSYGRFMRTFPLPEGTKPDQVEAHYENGVLHLAIPKGSPSKSEKISIKEGKPGFLQKLKGKAKASNE